MWSTYDANGLPIASVPLGYTFMSRTAIAQGTTTYTVPTGTRAIFIECFGAGGGGGGVADAATNGGAAGGGGEGAYSAIFQVAPKLTAFTVQVGLGGPGGTAGANDGTAGTDTTFDSPSICTAKGGSPGKADTVAAGPRVGGLGGAGGSAASGVGEVKISGAPGLPGISLAAAQNIGGSGGGRGGAPGAKTGGDGATATGVGGGGSGGVNLSSDANRAGGAGANGLIVVWEFA